MSEQLYFFADAALVDRLGRELVGKQETGLIELVKNAYDADATKVMVTIEPGEAITIEDDGTGMTRDDLVDGFLRLASTLKIRHQRSPRYRRQRAGRKGIGRFATQRLGQRLILRTWTSPRKDGLELRVDWQRFRPESRLEEIPVEVNVIPPNKRGTILRMEGLRDSWTEAQIRRCWRGVLNLQQPFPVKRVASSDKSDPGFAVSFLRGGDEYADPEVIADLKTEVLDHLHALIEFRVDGSGKAEWRLTENKFGKDRDWSGIHHDHRDATRPPRYDALKNVAMRAYYFILSAEHLPTIVFTRLRDTLREQGGIRLYRNGFRVIPYGDPDDDWLQLDEIYSRRSETLAPIHNQNFFGVVEVHDTEGTDFEESTSREGLIETQAFEELKGLATTVVLTAVNKIAEDRGRIGRERTTRSRTGSGAVQKLRDAEQRVRNIALGLAAQPQDPDPIAIAEARFAGEKAATLLRESAEVIESERVELADETALLRLLATLGLTAAEFSHETGMTFEAVRISMARVFKAARAARPKDVEFQADVGRAEAMINRLDALTGYLSSIASARAIRAFTPVSVSRELEKFRDGMRRQAERQEIELKVETPPLDALYTRPMHEADVATVLLNFYSNAVKAMRRTKRKRRMQVRAERVGDGKIAILFSDTGDGISDENRERVFDLFFTTRTAAAADADINEQVTGTGLGLWIVRNTVSNVDGEVRLVEPPRGYSTCFEVRFPAEEEDA